MKFNRAVFVIALSFNSHVLYAQICPEKIDVFEKIEHLPNEWTSKSTGNEHELTYMSVFDGDPEVFPLNISKPEFIQTRSKKVSYWDFRRSVGKVKEVGDQDAWMRCHYRATNMVIQRRINPDVTRCFIESDGKSKIHAGCQKE
jgi:hypothetical protein